MKKLSILAVILAMGTMCVAGCNMGGDKPTETTAPETYDIVMQEGNGEPSTPCPDGNCDGQRMPFAKPNFRFNVPHGGHGRGKFHRPHRKHVPKPEPENPETPETPEKNGNN